LQSIDHGIAGDQDVLVGTASRRKLFAAFSVAPDASLPPGEQLRFISSGHGE
jgi:hypothetical protein